MTTHARTEFYSRYTYPVMARHVPSYNFVDDRQVGNESLFRGSYDLINARVALAEIVGPGGQWEIALWGKNLTDNNYAAFTLDNLPQARRAVIWSDRRSYGLNIIFRYF